MQGTPAALAELVVWALIGTLSWHQYRRWQERTPTAAAAAATAAPAPAVADASAGDEADAAVDAEGVADEAAAQATEDEHVVEDQSSAPGEEEAEGSAAWVDKAGHAIVDAAEDEGQSKVHLVGSSVNLPDMSANLKTKVTVSEAQQSNPALLAAVYDDMAEKFVQHGLNLPAVEAMRQYYNLEGEGEAEPLEYAAFPTPLPPWAARLGVIFFQECNNELTGMVQQAAQEVMAALPEGVRAHANKHSHYHVTVYMASQPFTLRPDAFDASNTGLEPDGTLQLEQAPGCLRRELDVFRAATATTEPPRFEVHRLLLADSGTLLLCSVDHTGGLAKLRKKLRESFPGGPPKQSTIVHSSIARVLTPQQLTPEQIAKVQAVCDSWTERLRGQRFDPQRIYHIQEHTFTTVEGERTPLPFKGC